MRPETEGTEEKGSSGVPFINDPGNEDPEPLMEDATVPLLRDDELVDEQPDDEEFEVEDDEQ